MTAIADYDAASESTTVVATFTYSSFGTLVARAGQVSLIYGFTGQETDAESDLMFYDARYYDPTLGRFVSEDPIGFTALDTNLYRYTANNPINYVDPMGLEPFDIEIFWRNVELLAPSTKIFFDELNARLETGRYWNNASARYDAETDGYVVFLEEEYNEYEAAVGFVRAIREQSIRGLAGEFHVWIAQRDGDFSSEDFRDIRKWWYAKTAESAAVGAEIALIPMTIASEGADWVITIKDISEEISQGNWLNATIAGSAFLPAVSSGMVKISCRHLDDIDIVIPQVAARYLQEGKMGKGYSSFEKLKEALPLARGMTWHHLVQQHRRNIDLHGMKKIQNEVNVIRLPNEIHQEISTIQNQIRPDILEESTKPIREVISTRSYDEQLKFGIELVENVLQGKWTSEKPPGL